MAGNRAPRAEATPTAVTLCEGKGGGVGTPRGHPRDYRDSGDSDSGDMAGLGMGAGLRLLRRIPPGFGGSRLQRRHKAQAVLPKTGTTTATAAPQKAQSSLEESKSFAVGMFLGRLNAEQVFPYPSGEDTPKFMG
ncbi:very long-chain specific acyl-CoA dehydrogenase, mitochondrial-like, partial [Motacilla alba alba]|uniref:very long-chain specific acyl-CoA dehydrogenase, mitochondrial-like n=1 Tax=Motacilla alba alba TaxID=1094192 RepID=UPI0018D4DD66